MAAGYRPVYAADWLHGLAPDIGVQGSPGDLAVVDDPAVPGRKAVLAAIRRSADFSHVANGTPRAELLLPAPVKFLAGHDYLIRWSTYLAPVHWALRYVPDASGAQAVTELYKDGANVFRALGVPNAYAADAGGYLKLGLYKAGWQKESSDVAAIRIYFGPVSVAQRGGAPASLP
ncbi:hypothetical protein BJN34_33055 [Cupriavidus necator]|uniref:Uncharacterized protein n=1 Tax=Cupriavidus necator TaxID=106590 RepID=A0A1U9V1M8_CUPNE|nr:hypothetical protein [Cupriavidus necator]AQV98709.1 hypothetical protein BJN34_33055 [Cupriavidus necator]